MPFRLARAPSLHGNFGSGEPSQVELERLINRHKDAVYRQMIRTCGNREDAEDALADALIAAVKASDQLRDPSNFQAWLARIGTRACVRIKIRDRLTQFTPLAELEARGFEIRDDQVGPDREMEMASLKDCVLGALDTLPATYREVYVRREISGEKAEDVARELNVSLAAVKSRLHRARDMMREALDGGLGCRDLADSLA